MKKYLCRRKALEYWGFVEACETLSLPASTEYLVFSEYDCYRTSQTHWCKLKAARKYTENDVCTLPYLFLRYARHLDLLKLIYLGLQICACPPGEKAQCSVRKLRDCAVSLEGHPGRRKALQAIQYIQNNSGSPMESRLYMHLCLPNFLGGCGFPKAVLNKPVQVDSKQYYLDLYFPDTRLGIEYDSFEYHNNSRSFSQDNLRDAKLRTAGYRLIHVKPGQLTDLEAFQDLAVNISRQLKKPIVIRTTKFFEPFKEIFHFFQPTGYAPITVFDVPQFRGADGAYKEYLGSFHS